jgi:peptidoglycan/xylan/chitin deacetylase (PgdA/CDA1 family)
MMKKWILLLLFLPFPLMAVEKSAFVLCYHTFIGKKNISTDFSVAEFSDQIRRLRAGGIRIVSLDQIQKGQISGTRNALIMFDDGNITAYRAYTEVLKPEKLPAVFAVYPGIIGRLSYAMTWDQLREVHAAGNGVVVHGFFHMYLTDKFAQEKPKEFEDEFRRSKHVLEREMGVSMNAFVYPFGIVSASGKSQLKKEGYTYAYGLTQRPLLVPLSRNADLLDLPRYMLTRSNADAVIRQIVGL